MPLRFNMPLLIYFGWMLFADPPSFSFLSGIFGCTNALITVRATDSFPIVERMINYDRERKKLSIEYLKDRHGLIQDRPTIRPKMIVLHFTAGGTLNSVIQYFNKVRIESARKYNKNQSELNVSAHYLIDRDGTIYHLVKDSLFARHTIGLNYCAIGIENIGSEKEPLTEDQIMANAQLIRQICKESPIEYLIGHSEYGAFRGSPLWKETNTGYFTHKRDPGKDFMREVRKRVADLNLKATP